MPNHAARRRALVNLFHACMHVIMHPLKAAGVSGKHWADGYRHIYWCHPIFAIYIGNNPEQLLITACKVRECPICPVPHNELGDEVDYPLHNLGPILDALGLADRPAANYN